MVGNGLTCSKALIRQAGWLRCAENSIRIVSSWEDLLMGSSASVWGDCFPCQDLATFNHLLPLQLFDL
jgi:hypothetical protein